ncbi:unnamed protein product [Arabidopsis thaliana]|uniref:(thale cress) hypothetical protein n=1 Tax=Arabidopsis thaliana TaxID=3702 RepID=A0A5S9WLK6_ARATH|nr:unnamed protein product [Arabidopsis thaliana]CAD5315461.1 unnamed protein product [Arabidopsis thaliana]VYS49016.1 unnamed protein product [Arabidopsis thaliana]
MGHGQHIESKGSCIGISFWIQEAAIFEGYLLLDLNKTDADVILGYKWLSKLGETMIDWNENTMTFYNDTSWITINNKAHTSDGTKKGYKWPSSSDSKCREPKWEKNSLMGKVEYHNLEDKVGSLGEGRGMYARLDFMGKTTVAKEDRSNIAKLFLHHLGNLVKLMILTYEVSHSPRPPDLSYGEMLVKFENSWWKHIKLLLSSCMRDTKEILTSHNTYGTRSVKDKLGLLFQGCRAVFLGAASFRSGLSHNRSHH